MADNSTHSRWSVWLQSLGSDPVAYGASLALAILAIPLGLSCGLFYGGAALLLAVFSGLTVARLLRQRAVAEEKQDLFDEQLLQSQKLAAIGGLSAGIAHEINNPLAIIRQEAEWILFLCKQTLPPDMAEVRSCPEEIIRQVDRAREITHNLLNFARRRQPVVQAVNLNRLVEDMLRLVEKDAQQLHIDLIRQLSPDLPPIHSDGPLLRQVVLNLLNNAIQAIGREGAVTVLTHAVDGERLMLQISDTGCGIPRENLPHIFDPFFTTKPQGRGSGLGLSICHGIIDRLGGTISVASEVGKGSSFTIFLPLTLDRKEI